MEDERLLRRVERERVGDLSDRLRRAVELAIEYRLPEWIVEGAAGALTKLGQAADPFAAAAEAERYVAVIRARVERYSTG